jgi:hypothetical protein
MRSAGEKSEGGGSREGLAVTVKGRVIVEGNWRIVTGSSLASRQMKGRKEGNERREAALVMLII